jgi:hypothetical protein
MLFNNSLHLIMLFFFFFFFVGQENCSVKNIVYVRQKRIIMTGKCNSVQPKSLTENELPISAAF